MEEISLFFNYIILGLIQGFTEPLPISSSGHLIIVQHFFDIPSNNLHLEIFLNTASLIAIVWVYRKETQTIFLGTFSYIINPQKSTKSYFRFSFLIFLATIPAAIMGILFYDFIGKNLNNIHTVSLGLLFTGFALLLICKKNGTKDETDISIIDALFIGFAQIFSLIPGVSRSGVTLFVAILRKLKPDVALKFSFFLSIPISIGSLILGYDSILNYLQIEPLFVPYLFSFLACSITSIFSLKLLIHIVKNSNLIYFSIYCFIISLLIFLFI